LAQSTLREDVYDTTRSLCRDTLSWTASGESVTEMIEDWERTNRSRLSRARAMLVEIVDRGVYDVKTLSVATRQLRKVVSKAAVDPAAVSTGFLADGPSTPSAATREGTVIVGASPA
jgi:glutamate dehydrogenase